MRNIQIPAHAARTRPPEPPSGYYWPSWHRRTSAIYIKCCTNGLRLRREKKVKCLYSDVKRRTHINRIVFPSDIRHRPNPTFHRRMESMIVLQSQTEDCQHPTSVSFGLVPVLVPKKTSDGEFVAFYPELRSFIGGAEGHKSAVCGTNEAVWVFKVFNRTCRRLEFSGELRKVT